MKLVDLNPTFLSIPMEGFAQGSKEIPSRSGAGLVFSCPCGCGKPCLVDFLNPLDGGPPTQESNKRPRWKRDGETFENLTLTPSILRDPSKGGCGWHGFIRNGEVIEA